MSPILRSALALVVVLAFSACGEGGGTVGSVSVSMTEFAYTDSTWTVAAGEEFTLELSNDGSVIHNWALMVPGMEISSEGDLPEDPADRDDLYLFKEELDAGATVSRALIAPPAGVYQVICDIQAHFSAGMVGTLVVEG